jgi:hypothetical protein
VDHEKLEQFIGKVVGELGSAMGAMLILVGDKLGLFKAMAGAGPITPELLASKTDTHPRIIKEWLAAQAAGGYVTYDAKTNKLKKSKITGGQVMHGHSPVYE